jgi:hypothetical protein
MTIPRVTEGNENSSSIRRVVLSSGREIEVVLSEEADGAREARPDAGDLHVCRWCASPLVHPTSWEELDDEHWRLCLRCPDCELAAEGVFVRSAVERFDDELTRGGLALARDLRKLAHANMEDECERFIAAMHAGHILPSDF